MSHPDFQVIMAAVKSNILRVQSFVLSAAFILYFFWLKCCLTVSCELGPFSLLFSCFQFNQPTTLGFTLETINTLNRPKLEIKITIKCFGHTTEHQNIRKSDLVNPVEPNPGTFTLSVRLSFCLCERKPEQLENVSSSKKCFHATVIYKHTLLVNQSINKLIT